MFLLLTFNLGTCFDCRRGKCCLNAQRVAGRSRNSKSASTVTTCFVRRIIQITWPWNCVTQVSRKTKESCGESAGTRRSRAEIPSGSHEVSDSLLANRNRLQEEPGCQSTSNKPRKSASLVTDTALFARHLSPWRRSFAAQIAKTNSSAWKGNGSTSCSFQC